MKVVIFLKLVEHLLLVFQDSVVFYSFGLTISFISHFIYKFCPASREGEESPALPSQRVFISIENFFLSERKG